MSEVGQSTALFGESIDLAALSPDFTLIGRSDAIRRRVAVIKETAESGSKFPSLILGSIDAATRTWAYLQAPQYSARPALVTPEVFDTWIARFTDDASALTQVPIDATDEQSRFSHESLSLATLEEETSPVIRFVGATLFDALQSGASDVHIESDPRGLVVKFRLDGVLVKVTRVDGLESAEQIVSRVKVLSELDIAERRLPQDGRLSVSFRGRAIDVRVSVMPSVHGEDVVMRILDRQHLAHELQGLTLERLGFDSSTVATLKAMCHLPYGMVLVTGPTGAGKTTTLYAALTETRDDSVKVITIEDPVEYQLNGVLQIPVNEKKGLSFARGLRSILRHDPDRILVGEIRDRETAEIAVQAALTGHLVYTTVHANSAFDVLGRFSQLDLDLRDLSAALNGVLAQRLIRRVCLDCAKTRDATQGERAAFARSPWAQDPLRLVNAVGCERCRFTGYRGRLAIGEVLRLTPAMKTAFTAREGLDALRELAFSAGMISLRHRALQLVGQGLTTVEEMDRVTLVE